MLEAKILCVQAESVIGDLIRAILRKYQVTTAGSLEAARAQLSAKDFDLILLELKLPDGGGIPFCRGLRARGERAPILFIVGGERVSEGAIKNAGAQGYVEKNSSFLDDLRTRIDELLSGQ